LNGKKHGIGVECDNQGFKIYEGEFNLNKVSGKNNSYSLK